MKSNLSSQQHPIFSLNNYIIFYPIGKSNQKTFQTPQTTYYMNVGHPLSPVSQSPTLFFGSTQTPYLDSPKTPIYNLFLQNIQNSTPYY